MCALRYLRVIGLCGFLALAGCGGGGGSSSSGGTTSSGTLSGTAATGMAIAGATVVVEDANGNQATATTDSSGHYSLNASALTPPFLVQVTPASGPVLYSVSASASPSVINVTPLTDLILRSWYAVQSSPVTADTAFTNLAGNPPPTVTEVGVIEHVVRQVAALWLEKHGIDPSSFNLISTPFTANGSGADGALDQTTVTLNLGSGSGSGTVAATDGTTSQNSTVSFDSTTSTVTVATTTTSGGSTSTSSVTTIIPSTDAASLALAGIQSTLDNFANTVAAKGSSLTAGDLAPYIASTTLYQGLNASQFATQAASNFSGGKTLSFQLLSLDALDTTTNTATATFQTNVTQGGQTQSRDVQFQFVKPGSTWQIDGDQRYAAADVQAEERLDQGAQAGTVTPNPRFDINVDITSPQGILSGTPTVSGAGFGATPVAMTAGALVVDTYGSLTITSDHYFANTGSISPPTAGTLLTVALTANSVSTTYQFTTNAVTNEQVAFTGSSVTGSSIVSTLSSFTLGSPVTFNWTLPTTYPIAMVKLDALAYDGDQTLSSTHQCDVNSNNVLSASATSGSITIPTTCAGNPVVQVDMNLSVTGINGERSLAIWSLQ